MLDGQNNTFRLKKKSKLKFLRRKKGKLFSLFQRKTRSNFQLTNTATKWGGHGGHLASYNRFGYYLLYLKYFFRIARVLFLARVGNQIHISRHGGHGSRGVSQFNQLFTLTLQNPAQGSDTSCNPAKSWNGHFLSYWASQSWEGHPNPTLVFCPTPL